MMTCPYSEPDCRPHAATGARRCLCGRYLKHCATCGTPNRAFANHCRECGKALSPAKASWLGFKGGSRRSGSSDAALEGSCVTRDTGLRLRLGDSCRSLLGYDGHVIAVSGSGVVEIADPMHAKSVCRFQTQGPITAEPAIDAGILYVASRGQVSAYALAALAMEAPRVRPLWQVAVGGTPIQALTPMGARLYLTVAAVEWREVHVIEQQRARLLHAAPKVSWIAADPATGRAVFFSEDAGRVQLHVVGDSVAAHFVALQGLAEQPIALLGDTVFGVFGESRRLYRIDAARGDVEEPLEEDTQLYALTHDGVEWDRGSVRVDTGGMHFSRAMVRDAFAAHERAWRGSPVVVQNCAAVVAMENEGRILVYDLAALPSHEIWRLDGSRETPLTALAAFDSFVAAGNRDGAVEVRELVPKGATP